MKVMRSGLAVQQDFELFRTQSGDYNNPNSFPLPAPNLAKLDKRAPIPGGGLGRFVLETTGMQYMMQHVRPQSLAGSGRQCSEAGMGWASLRGRLWAQRPQSKEVPNHPLHPTMWRPRTGRAQEPPTPNPIYSDYLAKCSSIRPVPYGAPSEATYVRRSLSRIPGVYWDLMPDGLYKLREPAPRAQHPPPAAPPAAAAKTPSVAGPSADTDLASDRAESSGTATAAPAPALRPRSGASASKGPETEIRPAGDDEEEAGPSRRLPEQQPAAAASLNSLAAHSDPSGSAMGFGSGAGSRFGSRVGSSFGAGPSVHLADSFEEVFDVREGSSSGAGLSSRPGESHRGGYDAERGSGPGGSPVLLESYEQVMASDSGALANVVYSREEKGKGKLLATDPLPPQRLPLPSPRRNRQDNIQSHNRRPGSAALLGFGPPGPVKVRIV